jgi:hypothetical protein
MTQTPGDLWARLRRPLLDSETRFAWAAEIFRDLRLVVAGAEQPLEGLFARIVYNDADRQVLCVGFGEGPADRSACRLLVQLERSPGGVRVEVALAGHTAKEVTLAGRVLATHPGAGDAAPGILQGPFPAVAVLHV